MNQTNDRDERRRQREILSKLYNDYSPVRHDSYVILYQRDQEKLALESYLKNRGVK